MAAHLEGAGLTIAPAVTFGKVTEKADRVAIIANGPSIRALRARDFNMAADAGVTLIAVNLIIRHMPAHIWFTLDPDERVRPIMENPIHGVKRYAAVPRDYGTPLARFRRHQMRAPDGVTYLERRNGPGLADDPQVIHTGNSAFGALGIAYHMGARKVALFGVDGGRGYGYGTGSPRNLSHLPDLFDGAREQAIRKGMRVMNGSMRSLVRCFSIRSPKETLAWVMSEE